MATRAPTVAQIARRVLNRTWPADLRQRTAEVDRLAGAYLDLAAELRRVLSEDREAREVIREAAAELRKQRPRRKAGR